MLKTYAAQSTLASSAVRAALPASRLNYVLVSAVVTPKEGRRPGFVQSRTFATTPRPALKEFFSADTESKLIKRTNTSWEHPIYSEKQIRDIYVAHRECRNWSDRVALNMVRFLRFCTDKVTFYKHDEAIATGKKDAKEAVGGLYAMNERKWLIRMIFLESVAGVPGMVAGMLRHLHSLRRMRRDNGWIESLLEEAYNERMHLLTFLKMAEPGLFMKFMVLGAQGVFFNALFVSYLVSPRTVHRFVGYLEEEAVITYTRAIADIEAGKLPKWENKQAPDIAINYWKMPEGQRTIRDMLYYIRADEAKHREVNHTLANLHQTEDPNPFVSEYIDPSKPHPTTGINHIQPTGWERKDVI